MAYDIFLKIDGIDGESMDDKHKNEIEVLSWRWNIHQESTMHAGSGLLTPNRSGAIRYLTPNRSGLA
ncbi:Putative cytoplasmic protein [Salmonella enterica subsp. enterica serovar Hvittingfoss str. A4-620]|nr:Putative cytoplasmic protein [Salmonella enterica subsp. enterica serovar Hvittingfoss str. A4-620]